MYKKDYLQNSFQYHRLEDMFEIFKITSPSRVHYSASSYSIVNCILWNAGNSALGLCIQPHLPVADRNDSGLWQNCPLWSFS